MTCDEFENQLQLVLDSRQSLTEDRLLSHHAQSCGACHRKVRLYETLFQGLELAESPSLAPEFSHETSRAAQLQRPPSWKRMVGISMALAASLLALVAVSNHLNRGADTNSPSPSLAEHPPSAPASPERARHERPRGQRLPHSLAVIGPLRKPPEVAAPEEEVLAITSPDFEGLLHQWQVASQVMSLAETSAATTRLPGFRPLASSLTTAFSTLRQTLPGGRSESPTPEKPQAGMPIAADTHHA